MHWAAPSSVRPSSDEFLDPSMQNKCRLIVLHVLSSLDFWLLYAYIITIETSSNKLQQITQLPKTVHIQNRHALKYRSQTYTDLKVDDTQPLNRFLVQQSLSILTKLFRLFKSSLQPRNWSNLIGLNGCTEACSSIHSL
ncbi:uncharacterized protein LOC111381784 [Olea europaea var. sylvestris]|uniref:uncharacterized protein LOC111381784 n=1 Tax=Olea europaea var. sylvestris TaxID=158386 RepID=UPI000C1D069B|nr:uncharacterized protein LOC111381784 [Olea europaea var. sylvestris]